MFIIVVKILGVSSLLVVLFIIIDEKLEKYINRRISIPPIPDTVAEMFPEEENYEIPDFVKRDQQRRRHPSDPDFKP